MICITILDEVNCVIDGLDPQELRRLQDSIKFKEKGAHMTAAFRLGEWDGFVSMVEDDGVFGLYHIDQVIEFVVSRLGYGEDEIDLVDERPECPVPDDVPPVDETFLLKYTGHTLRDYQVDGINDAIYNRKGILHLATSAGKTQLTLGISKLLDPYIKTITIVPSAQLAKQTYDDYQLCEDIKSCLLTAKDSQQKRLDKIKENRHFVITEKLFLNLVDEFEKDTYAVMKDECFHPSHMLMGENGWKPVADFVEGEKVLAYNPETGKSAFEPVLRTVKKPFSGNLKHLKGPNGRYDLLVTPNHEQPYWTSDTGKLKRCTFGDMKKGYVIPTSAEIEGDEPLSDLDRLKIAFEADGHLLRTDQDGVNTYRFMFRRERKIERLESILNNLGKEYKKSVNIRGDTSITFKEVETYQKSIKWFDPFKSGKANAMFIEELAHWDGWYYENAKNPSLYWEKQIDKSETEHAYLIAKLGGYRPKMTEHINGGGHPVYRISSIKKDRTKLTNSAPIDVPYNGDVHCVTVPSGNLVTMREGTISITGNCHVLGEVLEEALRYRTPHYPIRIGLTGTIPTDLYKAERIKCVLGGGVLRHVPPAELISRGLAAKPTIKLVTVSHKEIESLFKTMRDEKEFEWSIEQNYMSKNVERAEAIATYINKIFKDDTKNTLVLCHAAFGKVLSKVMNLPIITDDVSVDERREMFSQFKTEDDHIQLASFGTSSTGISENRIFRLIMIDVGKDETTIIQSIGRGIRLDGVHNKVDVIDISSNTFYSTKHRKERIKVYKREKYDYHEDSNFIYV